jgi:N-acetylglutamate synthase-like GNAT family acetyltransferase
MLKISLLQELEKKEVEDFYHQIRNEKDLIIGKDETVIVAKDGGAIVGAVRIERPQEQECVLRTLYIDPLFRGKGVGSTLIQEVVTRTSQKTCYCLPYPHVRGLYEKFGFVEIEPKYLPPFLQQRYHKYKQSFEVIAMCRKVTDQSSQETTFSSAI